MSAFKEKLRQQNRRWVRLIVVSLRLILGGLFVFSGFVKGIDLYGFIYKIEEYLAAMDMTMPRSVTLVCGMTIAATEAVSGLLLAIGAYRKAVPVVMGMMMAVMLPLTGWLFIASPIDDCGCFGDAWILSNGASFLKNIFITAGVIYLIKYNKYVRYRLIHHQLQWLVWMGGLLYMVLLSLTCYNVQPMIDFRPYPEGSSLISQGDETADVKFVYTNGKENRVFTLGNLPQSEEWTFVEQIKEDNADIEADFAIYDGDEEVTADVIECEGRQMLFVVPEMNRVDLSYTYFVNELYRRCEENGIDFVGLLATTEEGIEWWKDYSMANYDCYSAEDTSLKTLVRGKMAIVYLENGVIVWKRTISSLVENKAWQNTEVGSDFPNFMAENLHKRLISRTLWLALWLFIVWICSVIIRRKTNNSKESKSSGESKTNEDSVQTEISESQENSKSEEL